MERRYEVNTTQSSTKAIGKTFGWMAIALLVTFAVAFLGAYLLINVLSPEVYYTILISASILQFILVFIIQFKGVFSKKQGSVIVPFMLYSICMGVIISSVIAITNIQAIITACGATVICFGLMAFVGYFNKSNINVMSIIAMGLGGGALMLSLVNILLGYNDAISWIVSFAVFAFVLLITIIDIYRLKMVAESGQMTENLAIYFAFNIYYDFIMIFLRVLSFVARFTHDN